MGTQLFIAWWVPNRPLVGASGHKASKRQVSPFLSILEVPIMKADVGCVLLVGGDTVHHNYENRVYPSSVLSPALPSVMCALHYQGGPSPQAFKAQNS